MRCSPLIQQLEDRLLFVRPYGVDISHYQTVTNWNSAKTDPETPIEFVFIKATEGATIQDDKFVSHMNGAASVSLPAGAYHFARPASDGSDAVAEANYFLAFAGSRITPGNLPPVLDAEDNNGLSVSAYSTWVNQWCQRVYDVTGVKPFIYCNTNYATSFLNSTVTQWPLWIAAYNFQNPQTYNNTGCGVWGTGAWKFWQYTDGGASGPDNFVNGIGACDTNVFNGTTATLADWKLLDREVTVLDGGTNIADGQATAINFGSVNLNATPPERTFTVRNDGDLLLTLSGLTVPSGYTITQNFAAASLRSGQSTTFKVRMDTTVAGTKTGSIQFTCNDANEATFNFPVTGTVNSPLNAPAVLTVTDKTATSVSLSWADTSIGETGFSIERKLAIGGTYAVVGAVGANVESFIDQGAGGPQAGQAYTYRVRAHDGVPNYSPYSNETTVLTLPGTVPWLSAADGASASNIEVSWGAATAASTYRLFRNTVNNPATSSIVYEGANRVFEDTAVAPNQTYYYWAAAVDSVTQQGALSPVDSGYLLVDTVAPTVTSSNFDHTTNPQRVVITISEDVSASVSAADLLVQDLTHSVSIQPVSVITLPGIAIFELPVLDDANYSATLPAGSVSDPAGNPLAADHVVNFFYLAGDANRDRAVNSADFNLLATSFGVLSGGTWSAGDFTYDGQVNSADFNVLATRFGMTLPDAMAGRSAGTGTGSLFGDRRIGDDSDDASDPLV